MELSREVVKKIDEIVKLIERDDVLSYEIDMAHEIITVNEKGLLVGKQTGHYSVEIRINLVSNVK